MRTEFQGMCLVATPGSKTIEHYDRLHPQIQCLFQAAKENLCTMCAENIAHDWAQGYKPSLQIWIEVIRQMEQGEIRGNPFDRQGPYSSPYTDPRAKDDYRSRPEYERQLAYQRFGGRSQDIDFGYDSPLTAYGPNPFARFQQENRDRDERPAARARYVQDFECDWTWSVGTGFEQALECRPEEIVFYPERTRRWP